MQHKRAIIIAVVVILVLAAGGVGVAMLHLANTKKASDMATQDPGTGSGKVEERHWDAEKQITQVGQEGDSESPGDSEAYDSEYTPDDRTMENLKSRYDSMSGSDDASQSEQEPEPDPRSSSVVQGQVGYDDIQNASVIEGGYDADDVRTEVVRYLEKHYPTEIISEIELLGNGSELSQDTQTPTSYVNYLVTLSKGQRIGLSVTCSTEYAPAVLETNYLVISPTLLYNVEEDEYVPMTITEEERIPADTVIDH